jgi:hypothetical protein
MIAFARGDAGRLPFPDGAFDLTVGSPPYSDCRMYLEDGTDPGVSRPARAWVEWMLRVTAECLRVTRGPVVWVVGCPTRDRTYQPIAEGLAWRWFAEGWTERGPGTVRDGSAYRPTYWHRPGIPGSMSRHASCSSGPAPCPSPSPRRRGRFRNGIPAAP